MVDDSPAAARTTVRCAARKHSPWSALRDRKKSKAIMASPECHEALSEEVDEDEEGGVDDHEMTEQEAQVLASFGAMAVAAGGGRLGSHGDADNDTLTGMGSAPDGQRRKVRGTRTTGLAAGFHSRLRSCMLNDKGSPVAASSRSFTVGQRGGAGGGTDQENTPPVLFAPPGVDNAKCWLARRRSPTAEGAAAMHQHQRLSGSSGITSFQAHASPADQSLSAAAAASHARAATQQAASCSSPAPKTRHHRRSLSNLQADGTGLNDSAETLQGHAPCAHAACLTEDRPHNAGCVNSRSMAPAAAVVVPTSSPHPHHGLPTQTSAATSRLSSSAAASCSHPLPSRAHPAPCPSIATYGIAAFGVPASVQSLFSGPLGQGAKPWPTCAADGSSVLALGLERVTSQQQPYGSDNTTTSNSAFATTGGSLGVVATVTHHRTIGPLAAGAYAGTARTTGSIGNGGSERAGLGRYGSAADGSIASALASAAAGGVGKGLVDSAEEVELRRLTRQQPQAQEAVRGAPSSRQHFEQRASALISGPSAVPSTGALMSAAFMPFLPSSAAPSFSAPCSSAPSLSASFWAPFDLTALAHNAGSILCTTSFVTNSFIVASGANSAVFAAAAHEPGILSERPRVVCVPDSGSGEGCVPRRKQQPLQPRPTPYRGQPRQGRHLACSDLDDDDDIDIELDDTHLDRQQGGNDLISGGRGWRHGGDMEQDQGHAGPDATGAADAVAADAAALDFRAPATAAGGCAALTPILGSTKVTAAAGGDGGETPGGQDDDDDGEPWLRTSQQAPDPDDPSSAAKYSAVLLRRLQAAAAHEELYGGCAAAAAGGCHSGPGGFYHLQESCGSEPCGYGYALRTGGAGGALRTSTSSMEPSPMPRLSSRLRRLRASPYPGGGSGGVSGSGGTGSGGPHSAQHTPSHLGARSRSAGVTPGGTAGTGRRLRRRSHLGSYGREVDIDELDSDGGGDDIGSGRDTDLGASPSPMLDQQQQHHYHQHRHHPNNNSSRPPQPHPSSSSWQPGSSLAQQLPPQSQQPPVLGVAAGCGMAASFTCGFSGLGGVAHHASHYQGQGVGQQLPPASHRMSGPGVMGAAAQRVPQQPGGPLQHRSQSQSQPSEEFLSGLMDYEDEGIEYTTPPHTPLRGIGAGHDAQTTRRGSDTAAPSEAGHGGATAAPPAPAGGGAVARLFCPGGGRGGPNAGVGGQLRVSFAASRHSQQAQAHYNQRDLEQTPRILAGGGSPLSCELGEGESDAGGMQWLVAADELEGATEFNRMISRAANDSDRGTAERLWHEMCSRGVAPDVNTLNALLRCLSRSAADPDDAQLLVHELCGRGGFSPNGTSQRLLEEIGFRFEQLAGDGR